MGIQLKKCSLSLFSKMDGVAKTFNFTSWFSLLLKTENKVHDDDPAKCLQ